MDGRERVLDQGSKGITSLGSLVWSLEEDDQISVWDCLAEADNGVGGLAGRKARGGSQRRPLGRRYCMWFFVLGWWCCGVCRSLTLTLVLAFEGSLRGLIPSSVSEPNLLLFLERSDNICASRILLLVSLLAVCSLMRLR